MTKISMGKQKDQSRLEAHIVAASESRSVINFKGQEDSSERLIKIIDLPPDVDIYKLAPELERLAQELGRRQKSDEQNVESEAVSNAAKSAAAGNREETATFLSKAGKWALDVATKIGTSVAIEAIKNQL